MGKRMKHLAAVAAMAVAAGAIGCGGSDSGSSGESMSAAAYAQQATVICNKAAERRAKGLEQAISEEGKATAERHPVALATEVLGPVYREMVEELSALEVPAGKKGQEYELWVESFEELLQRSEADHSWFFKAYVGPHRKAKRAGLRACAAV